MGRLMRIVKKCKFSSLQSDLEMRAKEKCLSRKFSSHDEHQFNSIKASSPSDFDSNRSIKLLIVAFFGVGDTVGKVEFSLCCCYCKREQDGGREREENSERKKTFFSFVRSSCSVFVDVVHFTPSSLLRYTVKEFHYTKVL